MGHDGPAPEGVTVATALMDAPADAPSRTARTRAGRPRGLTVQVSVDERDVITVRAVGNLDIYTASELRQRLSRHDPAGGRVVLDVSAVTLVDSAGLGTLMSFANRARRGGSRLTLICTPQLAELLEIARLTDAFDLRVVREE
jgi:anti-anti-sigma factor